MANGLVLVTGGAGFIGSHLVDRLVEAGQRVRVLDNLDPQVHGNLAARSLWPAYANPLAEYCLGDVCDPAALSAALQGVTAVVHLAAATGVGQSMYRIADYFAVNVQGTANLLDRLANAPHTVGRLVVASSRAIYGEGAYLCPACGPAAPAQRTPAQLDAHRWEPLCPNCAAPLAPCPTPESKLPAPGSMYAITKLAQEHMLLAFGQAYNLPAVALRFFNVYGPRQALSNPYTGIITVFLNRLRSGLAPEVYEDGGMTRDFVHVADAARACRLALDSAHSGAYNIGGGQAVSILALARQMCAMLGPDLAPTISGLARVGDIRHCTADLTLAAAALGYHPQVTLAAGLQDVIAAAAGQPLVDRAAQAREELERQGLLRG